MPAYLAVITTLEENNDVKYLMGTSDCWIGASDAGGLTESAACRTFRANDVSTHPKPMVNHYQ